MSRSLATVPGFAQPVDDAQVTFRAVLEAFSRPGLSVALPVLPFPLPYASLSQGMTALALALCDHDTPVWLDAVADTPEARHHLRFHCGAPFAPTPAQAAFAFIACAETMPRLSSFSAGLAAFPDRSATLVIRADLSACAPAVEAMQVTGPGVKGNDCGAWQDFRIGGLPSWFWADWEENRAGYPLGVDVVFVDAGIAASGEPFATIVGLPRTSRVRSI